MAFDAERVRVEQTYRARIALSKLWKDLDEMGASIEGWVARRRKLNALGFLLMPAGFLCLIAGAIAGFAPVAILGAMAGIAGIGMFIYSARYARGCCKNRKRFDTLRDLASIVKDDAEPKSHADVQLSFRSNRVLLKEEPFPQRKKGKQKFFRDTWLRFETELLDGTALEEEVTDLIRERRFVNPRGKTKVKTRVRQLAVLRVSYPAATYGDLSGAPAKLRQDIRLPTSATCHGVRITNSDIKIKAVVESPADLKAACSAMALGAYRILNYGRRLKQGPVAEGGAA